MAQKLTRSVSHMEAHHRLGISLVCGALALAFCRGHRLPLQLIVAWDAFAICFLALAWARILTSQARLVVGLAKLQHASRRAIFIFMVGAACASFGAVAFLLSTAKALEGRPKLEHIVAAVGTVALSWFLVHTVFTLHYAYLYYRRPPSGLPDQTAAGLQFPSTPMPDYSDFAYFSFVIGMTSQVSDVQISSHQIRQWALVHGLISFGFNAAILGLSINVISGLF